MRVRVHRGTREIGGSCVELEADGERIVLDAGRPLSASMDEQVPMLAVSGFGGCVDTSLLGVVLSHSHPDHYGLMSAIHPAVAAWAGAAASRVLKEAAYFTPAGLNRTWNGHLRDRQRFKLGTFTVTPFLVDHSAFDAYAFLVEANGRRLFYSGDLRAHGRKASAFQRLVVEPPRDIDVLLLEGTRVGPEGQHLRSAATERDVERSCIDFFRETEGLALVAYSPQNIDRLVTLYRAAVQSDRDFVMDLYAATMAKATGNPNIPQAGWDRVRVFVPHAQRLRVLRSREFERVRAVRRARIFADELRQKRGELVLSFRPSMAAELERMDCLLGASVLWSMWSGYLEEPRMQAFTDFLERNRIPMTTHHASGHASVRDLQRFAQALAPRRVVPIHTAAPERFPDLFDRVEMHRDGEWWEV